jgi:hypothetical protein
MNEQPHSLLLSFLEWGNNLKKKLNADSIVELNLGPKYNKQSSSIDLENVEFMTRIILWESGEYHCDTIEIESEKYVDSSWGEDIDESNFEQVFGGLIRRYIK